MAMAALVAAAALIGLPVTAASANVPSSPLDITTVTTRVWGTTGTVVHGLATCPAGTTAVSGGFIAGQIRELGRTSLNDRFYAYGLITRTAPVNFYDLTVNCASESLVTDTVSISAAGRRVTGTPLHTHTRVCPNGGYAFSGGGAIQDYNSEDTFTTIANTPTADGHGWTYTGVLSVPATGWSYPNATLRCFNAAAAGLRARIVEEVVPFNSEEVVTIVDNCSGVSLSGGVSVINPDGSPAQTAAITTTRWMGTGWQGAARLPRPTINHKMIIRSLCVTR